MALGKRPENFPRGLPGCGGQEFYSTHYSANLMRLVVYGRQSLDELEELARTKFTGLQPFFQADGRQGPPKPEPDA